MEQPGGILTATDRTAADLPPSVAADQQVGRSRYHTLLLIAPLLVLLAVLLVWPLVTLALASGAEGLTSYAQVLTSSRYLQIFGQTAAVAAISTGLAVLLCVPAAIYLEQTGGRQARVLATALTLPLSLPGIVIGFFVILLFGTSGVVPEAVQAVTGQRSLRLAYTTSGLLLGYLYFQIPRVVLVIRGAAGTVDWNAVAAARTLGAGTLAVYRGVVLPTLGPAIISATGLGLATAFGAFGTAATLSRGFEVVPLEIAAAFTERFQPELAATLSILLAAVTTSVLVGLAGLRPADR